MRRLLLVPAVALTAGALLTAIVSADGAGPYPAPGSCQVFPRPPASISPRAPSLPTEAAWNQDVSRAPRDPRSRAYVAYIDSHGAEHLHPDFGSPRAYGFPYAVVGAHRHELPVHYTAYGEESDPGPFPIPPRAPVEGGNRSDGDRHVLVVDRSACRLYELYGAFYRPRPRPHWDAGSGAAWNLRSAARRPDSWTSADAAGLPIFPGLVRYDEVAAGRLHHAIRVTFDSTRDAWVHPASHCAGDTSDPAAPPMGLRLRLKASFDISRFHGASLVILQTLKRYGMLVADNGSNWFITGATDTGWDDNDLNQLKSVPGTAFEVVNTGEQLHR